MKKLKGLLKFVFGRTAIVVTSLLIQALIIFSTFGWLAEYTVIIYMGFALLSILCVIHIINEEVNSSFKMVWIVLVFGVPVFGVLLYLLVKLQTRSRQLGKRLDEMKKTVRPFLLQDEKITEKLHDENIHEEGFVRYMNQNAGYPAYAAYRIKYFPTGREKLEELLLQLEKAESFIFMEFFIVVKGYMLDRILEVLKRKVSEGVEVRFMYDGMCSMLLLPYHFPKELESYGIKYKVFSPIRPILSTSQNNRDHRKIVVIDGKVAFTGGINIADEYINRLVRFGYWKDAAVMTEGECVKSFTIMFLQMWNLTEYYLEDFSAYIRKQCPVSFRYNGYIIPYADDPLDKENVGKQVYIDILNRAKEYVHIMTPYLVLDDEMRQALMYSVKRGVETIIIMPHIPDKQSAYLLARTYYPELIEAGVKIYEYMPGFVHAKVFVSDDERAVVGTINLDFRSLYLHFECAAYIYKNTEIKNAEKDFQYILAKAHEVTQEECKTFMLGKRLIGKMLRFFAPLM